MRRSRRTSAALLAPVLSLMLLVPGCSYWRVHQPGPASLISQRNPERVQVVARDSTRILLDRPQVVGDSLVGFSGGARVAVALADVTAVAERRTHVLATAAVTYGVATLVSGIVWSSDGWE